MQVWCHEDGESECYVRRARTHWLDESPQTITFGLHAATATTRQLHAAVALFGDDDHCDRRPDGTGGQAWYFDGIRDNAKRAVMC